MPERTQAAEKVARETRDHPGNANSIKIALGYVDKTLILITQGGDGGPGGNGGPVGKAPEAVTAVTLEIFTCG